MIDIDIVSKIKEHIQNKIKRTPCHTTRASSLGYAVPELGGCLRRGVYERINWQEKELISPEVQMIFDEGNDQEKSVLRLLAESGIVIIEQQSYYEWKDYDITGHIDGKILIDDKSFPLEIKSMSPNIFESVNTFEDFKKKPWTRSYMAQITLYMLMEHEEEAVFILKNKSSGAIKQINVKLDYDLGEFCLRAAETIKKCVEKKEYPEKISDREVCKKCPFRITCMPDINFGEPLKIEDDPEFEKRIARYSELKASSKEANALYEIIKERSKASCGDKKELNIMVGNYVITGKKDVAGSLRLKIQTISGDDI